MKAADIIALIIMLIRDELESPDTVNKYRIGRSFTSNRKLTFKALGLIPSFQRKESTHIHHGGFQGGIFRQSWDHQTFN